MSNVSNMISSIEKQARKLSQETRALKKIAKLYPNAERVIALHGRTVYQDESITYHNCTGREVFYNGMGRYLLFSFVSVGGIRVYSPKHEEIPPAEIVERLNTVLAKERTQKF